MGDKSNPPPVIITDLGHGLELHWKYNELIRKAGVTSYRLSQDAPKSFKMGTLHRWTHEPPIRPDMGIVAALLVQIGIYMHRPVHLDELLEIKPTVEQNKL